MAQRGFSLIELIVVISIISILLALATLNFHEWQLSRGVERQTREMQADLANLRMRALHTKMKHSVTLRSSGYEARSFSDAADPGTLVMSRVMHHTIATKEGNALPNKTVSFDSMGFTSNLQTLRISTATTGAALDCIVISNARTNMGKFTNGTCIHQ